MDIYQLQDFFFWCMLINSGVYAITAVAVSLLRKTVVRIQKWVFGLDDETIMSGIYKYLAAFKLFITVFNFAPWIALMIINS